MVVSGVLNYIEKLILILSSPKTYYLIPLHSDHAMADQMKIHVYNLTRSLTSDRAPEIKSYMNIDYDDVVKVAIDLGVREALEL